MTVHVHEGTVERGDSDPTGLVFYSKYYRWTAATAYHLFDSVGIVPEGAGEP